MTALADRTAEAVEVPPRGATVVASLHRTLERALRRPVDVRTVTEVHGHAPQVVATPAAVAPEVTWPDRPSCTPQAAAVQHEQAGVLTTVAVRTGAAVDWADVNVELEATAALLAAMVAEQVALGDLRQDVDDLAAAMRTRAVIDQAIGVVMAHRRCTPAQALDVLRTASQHDNVKVSALAARIVDRVTGRPDLPPEPFLPRRRTPGRSIARPGAPGPA